VIVKPNRVFQSRNFQIEAAMILRAVEDLNGEPEKFSVNMQRCFQRLDAVFAGINIGGWLIQDFQ
jgi:hypothetical protein